MPERGPLIRNISETALWVAVYRAREMERPDAAFRDPFARRLAGPRGEEIARSFPFSDKAAWAWVARTVLFDQLIEEQVRAGADLVVNLAAGQVSMRFGAKGPNEATATACTTSAHSIGDSFRIIQHNDADVMIAGGAEAAITPMGVGGFAAMRALSTRNDAPEKASRPWDKDRDGFVIGEGAGILILEELEFAKARGAKILAEVIGYGMSADAYHMTGIAPEGAGAQRAMRAALKDAGIKPEDVGYVNAHATSTPAGDGNESRAIELVFGEHATSHKLKISGTKSMHGHLLGGAGGLEAGITVLALQHQMLPPTINLENVDPECKLDYVPNKAIAHSFDIGLSNSFGFGGINATLIMRRWTE